MDFMTSYKQLEKLCGEIFEDDRKISAYIDEMVNTPRGSFYVSGWNDDLNMCEPQDALWLDNFYARIMNQTDPLALYAKATKPKSTAKTTSKQTAIEYPEHFASDEDSHKRKVFPIFLTCIIIIVVVVLLYNK